MQQRLDDGRTDITYVKLPGSDGASGCQLPISTYLETILCSTLSWFNSSPSGFSSSSASLVLRDECSFVYCTAPCPRSPLLRNISAGIAFQASGYCATWTSPWARESFSALYGTERGLSLMLATDGVYHLCFPAVAHGFCWASWSRNWLRPSAPSVIPAG